MTSVHVNWQAEHRLRHCGASGLLDLSKYVAISSLPQQGHESCSELFIGVR
jgi:hypothetical protein